MDSTVLLYSLIADGHKVHCLHIDYGQRHVQELVFARHHCHRLKVNYTTLQIPPLKGSFLTDGKGGNIVPFRNAIFLAHAVNLAVEAEAEWITMGCNQEDESAFPDCRMAFMQAFNQLLMMSGPMPCEVVAPFIQKSKAWIVAKGKELGVELPQTWSCYWGGEQPCPKKTDCNGDPLKPDEWCDACRKREAAFKCA